MVYNVLDHFLEVLGGVLECKHSRNEILERLKEERERFLEEVNPYKMERQTSRRRCWGRGGDASNGSVSIRYGKDHGLSGDREEFVNKHKEQLAGLSQSTASGDGTTDKVLKIFGQCNNDSRLILNKQV